VTESPYLSALRERAKRELLVQRILSALHAKQREFAQHPSRRIAAHSGRRSGKSHGIAGRLMTTAARNPGQQSVFIAISAARANDIIGRAFHVLGDSTGFRARSTKRDGQLYFEFPNGHAVWVAGCKNRADAEKFRGSPLCGAAVDESDSMRGHLEYLSEEVLEPALLDEDGWLALTGTPGVTPTGYFHAITTGEGCQKWPTFNWTVLDNPFLPHAREWLAEKCRRMGLDPTSPSYLREWLGQWVLDVESLCYPYNAALNHEFGAFNDEGKPGWRYVLGVDLGVNDPCAFVLVAYRPESPELHIVEATQADGLSPSGAAARVLQYRERFPGLRIVADTGGQGKAFVEEWIQRFGLPAEPAYKLGVAGQIALVTGLLRSGSVKVHSPAASDLIAEWMLLPFNSDRDGHDSGYADHLSDAARYAILAAQPRYTGEQEDPEPGTVEFTRRQLEREREAAFKRGSKIRRTRGGLYVVEPGEIWLPKAA